MAKNLSLKGSLDSPIIVWNRTVAKAEKLRDRPVDCKIAESVTDAVTNSDIIFSCLANDEAATAVYEEAFKVDITGKLFVSCETITPELSEKLAGIAVGKGGGFVSMPVFGETGLAEKGLVVCAPAGEPEHVKRVMPYTTGVIGRAVIDLSGEPLYKASLLKLIGGVFIVAMIETTAEGHVLAEKTGLGHGPLQKLIQAVFPGPAAFYSDRMVTGKYYNEPPFAEIHMVRNLGDTILNLAKNYLASVKGFEVGQAHLEMVKSYEGKNKDISGVYGAVRLESGLPYEN